MPTHVKPTESLTREFLDMRSRLLELAASFDRIERGVDPLTVQADHRYAKLLEAVRILGESQRGRAERIQLAFSLPYEDDWKTRP